MTTKELKEVMKNCSDNARIVVRNTDNEVMFILRAEASANNLLITLKRKKQK